MKQVYMCNHFLVLCLLYSSHRGSPPNFNNIVSLTMHVNMGIPVLNQFCILDSRILLQTNLTRMYSYQNGALNVKFVV